MRIAFDIEANGLVNPDKIFVIVCKDIDTNEYHIFRELWKDTEEVDKFRTFCSKVKLWIGHNVLSYDIPVISKLMDVDLDIFKVIDTLIISKLIDYPRQGHSIESYGEEFNFPKGFQVDTGEILESKYFPISFYSKYSKDLENYCIRDVDIVHKIYTKYSRYINSLNRQRSITTEHLFQYYVVNSLEYNGFSFNIDKASRLLSKVEEELNELDKSILTTFLPRLKPIREVVPRSTKYGTISLSSIPKVLRSNIHELTIDAPFTYCVWEEFNPSSHKQIIRVLNEAGWRPVDKTKTHIDTERQLNILKFKKNRDKEVDKAIQDLYSKLEELKTIGWKVNENNLDTLPPNAPTPARLLAKRILLESRRRTLTEWLNLVDKTTSRIHGKFYGIGAWTHRMAHQNPNTANIPNEFDTQGKKKLYGKELRTLWCAPRKRLLTGVDAEGIQLRIFAHYINDPAFTKSLVEGKKEDKSDPHSLNQSILGDVCKSRAAAKRYIYALLLGAGQGKLREILDCTEEAAQEAYERLLQRYTGFAELKETIIPADAKRGWFVGLDGRAVRIPGDSLGSRRHLAMSGYLQNGEAVVMKMATLKWVAKLKDYGAKLVNFVHDEWQVECPNDISICLEIAKMMAQSLVDVGEELELLCPLAGSYWNDDLKDYTIGTNWAVTH